MLFGVIYDGSWGCWCVQFFLCFIFLRGKVMVSIQMLRLWGLVQGAGAFPLLDFIWQEVAFE